MPIKGALRSAMNTMARIASTGLVVCSGIAFGVTAMTGVVAAVIFPAMREIDPTLGGYAGYDGPHWSLAAGVIAEKMFHVGFVVTGVMLGLSLTAVLGLVFLRRIGGMPIVRLGLVVVTLGLFLTHVGWLQPRMDRVSRTYREAARTQQHEVAAAMKVEFDDMHPLASKLVGASALSALALFMVSAWAASAGRKSQVVER